MFKSPGCTEPSIGHTDFKNIRDKKLPLGEPHERSQSHHNQYIIQSSMIFGAINTGDNSRH